MSQTVLLTYSQIEIKPNQKLSAPKIISCHSKVKTSMDAVLNKIFKYLGNGLNLRRLSYKHFFMVFH